MKRKVSKSVLKILLVVLGLNTFTACYGMPPGDWDPLPGELSGQDEPEVEPEDETVENNLY